MIRSTHAARLIRIADLLSDPRVVGRLHNWAAQIDAAPAERQIILLCAVALVEPALAHLHPGCHRGDLRKWTPYPTVRDAVAARLLLGEGPRALAPGLTRREAHLWCRDGAPEAVGYWVVRHRCRAELALIEGVANECERRQGWSLPRGLPLPVALWLCDRLRDPSQREALVRQRRAAIAGQWVEGSYWSRLDELRKSDLRPSVEVTFARAGERVRRAVERALQSRGEPLCPEPAWWQPIRCARLLRTGQDLVAEGRALKHCVAAYAGAVRARRSVVVGLCVLGHRTTVELDPHTLAVRQHCGQGNRRPDALSVRALESCLTRWRRRAGVKEE